MEKVDLSRDFVMTIPGATITVSAEAMVITPTIAYPVAITGPDYDRLCNEIARYASPAAIMGKPIRGIGGEDIYMGIRKRQEGL
jgi:hypothetical protein